MGGIGLVGTISLAPYVLPSIGIGSASLAHDTMAWLSAGSTYGTGLAGGAQALLASIPGIGSALTSAELVTIPGLGVSIASGALASVGLTALIGIGGTWLANWMETHEQADAPIHWSKVVRYASLATSAMIALPGIISGLAVGIAFLSGAVGLGMETLPMLRGTLGATTMPMDGGLGGLAAVIPHLFTCGLPFMPVAAAMFMDMKHQPSAQRLAEVHLMDKQPTQQGRPIQLTFTVTDAAGAPLPPQAIATTHTQKLHTMVIDQSLSDYHHLHPQYDPATGLYQCSFTPRLNARYSAWHDFTVAGNSAPTILRTSLPAAPSCPERLPRLLPASHAEAGGLCIDVQRRDALVAGEPGTLRLRVTDAASGQPVNDLQPIMGAYGHLAGFSENGSQFIHSHPMTEPGQPVQDGMLDFHVVPTQPGMTKFFLQLKHHGQEVTLPFVQPVRQKEQATERYLAAQQAMTPRLAPAL